MIGKTNAVIGGSGGASHVEITFTVEGANGDNITIADESGEIIENIIFDTNVTSAEYTMFVPIEGAVYTFTSSVAKAIDGSNADYSKNVLLTPSTDAVKVMPEGAIKWYGNEVLETIPCGNITGKGGTLDGHSWVGNLPTYNDSTYTTVAEYINLDISPYSSLKAIMSADRNGATSKQEMPCIVVQKVEGGVLADAKGQIKDSGVKHLLSIDVSAINELARVDVMYSMSYNAYPAVGRLYALWLE